MICSERFYFNENAMDIVSSDSGRVQSILVTFSESDKILSWAESSPRTGNNVDTCSPNPVKVMVLIWSEG